MSGESMKRFIGIFIIIAIIALFVVMVVTSKTKEGSGEYIDIITTSYPTYDFARAITKDTNITVQQIMAPGTELHDYEPEPEDLLILNKAKIVVATCGESEKWFENAKSFIYPEKTKIICITDYIDMIKDEDGDYDDHVWTSLKNVIKIIKEMSEEFKKIFPDRSELFSKNVENYSNKLKELDDGFAKLAKEATKPIVVADRFPFHYFINDYNFDYYAAFPGCIEQSEASASTIAQLIDVVKNQKIKTIFTLELSDQKVAKTIAEATGADIKILHSAHNISKKDYENGATYYDIMKYNLNNLTEALK